MHREALGNVSARFLPCGHEALRCCLRAKSITIDGFHTMRIIVAGIGEVGRHLATMLASSYHAIVAIDPKQEKLDALAEEADLVTIAGSATSFAVLQEARVEGVDLFVAVASQEETNIIAAIMAKKLGAKRVVARVDSNEYLKQGNTDLLRSLGIDSLIYPEKLASQVIIGLLGEAGTMELVEFSHGKLSLASYKLEEGMQVVGLTLRQVDRLFDEVELLIAAVTREGETLIPKGNDTLQRGDIIHLISTQKGINCWRKLIGTSVLQVNTLFVLGASRMGLRTCLDLEGKVKTIKLFENDREKCEQIAPLLHDTLLIRGDGRNTNLLLEEGLEGADAFVAVTGSSETNILTCLAAWRAGVRRIIAEVENLDYIAMAESMGIDSVVNKKLITASRIFRYTMGSDVSSVHYLTGSDAEVMEFVVQPHAPVTRGRLKDINFPRQAIVGGVVRGDSTFIAKGDTQIVPGDRVVVFAVGEVSKKVERFFG